MKKFFSYFLIFAMLLQVSIGISSCNGFGFGDTDDIEKNEGENGKNNGDDNGENGGGDNGNNNGSGNNGGSSDQVYKDKEDFQNIALELRNEFKASDFENIMDLAEYISKEYADYYIGYAEDWFEECMDGLWREIERGDNYEIYESIYKLSVFKGKWVANKDSMCWQRSEASNLSLHVQDQYGNPCEVTLTTSGKTKRVHVFDEEDYWGNGQYDENGYWYYEEYQSTERIYFEVPENVNLVLKQNGKKLAEVVINVDLSSMSGQDFNLAKDKYNVKANVYFNGYSLNLENAYYENNKESKAIASFKHGNKTLLSASLTATPEIYVTNFEEDWEEDDINFKNNVLSINILNKLELKGTCNDLKPLVEIIDSEFDEHTDSKINKHLKINAYFYGSKVSTAKIEFESIEDGYYDEWEGRYYPYWELSPIIEFNDYSRHSLEDFFNEDDFQTTINAFESLLREFEDLVYGYDFDF